MTVETHVHAAVSRIDAERESVTENLAAVDRFAKRVDDLPTVSETESVAPRSTTGGTLTASTVVRSTTTTADRCGTVRELFAETIRPHSVDDVDRPESLQETIAAEFGTEIVAALAPATNHQFSPELKRSVLSATRSKRTGLETMSRALETEADSLQSAATTIESITDWIEAVNDTTLLHLGFDELRDRHETLAQHRSSCRTLLRDRQGVLHGTTAYSGTGLEHRSLVGYLYRELPVTYPVLSTTLRLETCCRRCQRTVRDHLTRRV